MDDIHSRIIEVLSGEKKPLMIKTIAERCMLNPQTIARKLDTLELLGRVRKIQIGNAKKYYLIDTLQVSGLIDISSDLILILNTTHVIQYINHSAEKFLNLENRQVIGEKLDFLNLDIFSSPEVLQGLQKFNHEKAFRAEIPDTRNGSLHWYYVAIIALTLKINTISIAIIVSDITSKKQIERKLKESEAKYRLISENSTDVIWLLDVHSLTFLYVSPSIYELLGYQSEELMEFNRNDFVRTSFGRQILHFLPQRITNLLSGDESARVRRDDVDQTHKSGSIIPVEMVTTLITDETGEVTKVLGVSRDISQRRLSEKALQKSQEHTIILGDILERSFQPIIVSYPDQSIDYCNSAFEKLLGYSCDEIRDMHLTNPAKWAAWKEQDYQMIEKMHRTGQPVRFERILVDRNGRKIPVEMTTHLIRDPESNIIRYYGFVTDITERKLAEEKIRTYQIHLEDLVSERTKTLQESEERFRQVVENAGEWIWEIDNEGEYRYCSPIAFRICGYTPEELVGSKFPDLFPPNARDELLSIILSVTGRQESFRQFQIPMIHKNGSVIRVETSGTPVYDSNGLITGYRGTYADITEQTRMERALLESRNYNRFLFEDSPIPLILMDADTMTYLDFNTHTLELYGYSSEKLVGRKVGILLAPPGTEPENIQNHIQRCLTDGRTSYETRYQKPDGEIWSGLVSLVRFEHGQKNQILFCFQEYPHTS